MKKYVGLLLVASGLWACTSPEQDAQIQLFWAQQMMKIMQKRMPQQAPLELSAPTEEQPEQQPVLPQEEQPPLEAQEEPAVPAPVQPGSKQQSLRRPITQAQRTPAARSAKGVNRHPKTASASHKRKTENTPRFTEDYSAQFMKITMEDEHPRPQKINTRAPQKERLMIERALAVARQSNQKAVDDIGMMFGPETQAEAAVIVANAEELLEATAAQSTTAQKYLNVQSRVLREQEKKLNQLMQRDARNIRSIRG